ncbi:MAG: acyl-CoA dehydrogenase C-terminal domain-containing protein, partial [Rubrivivax sp.]
YGIEQSLRDARIAMIYEGTNEIQAIDLLQRKVLADGGAALRAWLDEARAEARRCADAGLADFAAALDAECDAAAHATAAVAAAAASDREAPLRAADDYLMGLSHTMLAWAWASSARAALGVADRRWADAKTARMRYGLQWLLPQAAVHWQRVRAVDAVLPGL